jgi:transcriptional regulator with XRE-family HTH domain
VVQSTSELTDILSALRLRKGISIKELSQKLGVSQAAVSQWIHGARRPRLQRLLQILTYLDASPQETEHILTISGYNQNGDPKAKAVPVPTNTLQQLERKATRIAALYSELEKEIDDLQALARQEIVAQSLSSGISSVTANEPVLVEALKLEEALQQVESTAEAPQRILDQPEDEIDWLIATAHEYVGQQQINAAWRPIARLNQLYERYSHDELKLFNIHLLLCGANCASGYFFDAEKWGQVGLAESIKLKMPEKTIELRYLLAVILNALGKGTAALEQVNNALEETDQLSQQSKENVMFSKARIMALKGEILRDLGQWEKAMDYLQETMAFAHQSGALFAEAIALSNMTVLYTYQKEPHYALGCCRQCWELKKEVNKVSPIEKAYYHLNLGKVHRSFTENTENQQMILFHAERGIHNLYLALYLFDTAGDKFHAAQARLDLAFLDAHSGTFARALKLGHHTLQFSEEAGLVLLQAKAHTALGIIYTLQDSYPEAKDELDKSLAIFQQYRIERPYELGLIKDAQNDLQRLSGVS